MSAVSTDNPPPQKRARVLQAPPVRIQRVRDFNNSTLPYGDVVKYLDNERTLKFAASSDVPDETDLLDLDASTNEAFAVVYDEECRALKHSLEFDKSSEAYEWFNPKEKPRNRYVYNVNKIYKTSLRGKTEKDKAFPVLIVYEKRSKAFDIDGVAYFFRRRLYRLVKPQVFYETVALSTMSRRDVRYAEKLYPVLVVYDKLKKE